MGQKVKENIPENLKKRWVLLKISAWSDFRVFQSQMLRAIAAKEFVLPSSGQRYILMKNTSSDCCLQYLRCKSPFHSIKD